MSRRHLTAALAAAALAAFAVSAVDAQTAGLTGHAIVSKGDSVRIGAHRIRLASIDAPEPGVMCGAVDMGERATSELVSFIGGADVTCHVRGRDTYGRDIGSCSVHGDDIALHMVSVGWARAHSGRASPDLMHAQTDARTNHRGAWEHECRNIWGY